MFEKPSVSAIKVIHLLQFWGVVSRPSMGGQIRSEAAKLGNEIISHFNFCIPHIVRFPSELPINYKEIKTPFSHFAFNNASVLDENKMSDNLDERNMHLQSRYHIDIPRRSRCLLVLLSTTYQVIANEFDSSWYLLSYAAGQRAVLYSPSGSSVSTRMLINYFVYFIQSAPSSPTYQQLDWNYFTGKLYAGMYGELSPVFAFLSSSEDPSQVKYGRLAAFYCLHCPINQMWWSLSCTEPAICAMSMRHMLQGEFRRRENIPWRYRGGLTYRSVELSPRRPDFCPLTLKPNLIFCGATLRDGTVSFLLEVLNWTIVEQIQRSGPGYKAVIAYDVLGTTNYPVDVIVLQDFSSKFRFITSDSVAPVGASFAHFFTSPFDSSIWLCLGVTATAISIIMVALSSEKVAKAAVVSTLATFSLLVEQFTIKLSQPATHVAIPRAIRTIVLPWIFAALVITNTYKGVMKSNYMLETAYSMPWKNLSQMKGFAFIFAHDVDMEYLSAGYKWILEDCQRSSPNIPTTSSADIEECIDKKEPEYWANECHLRQSTLERNPCDFFDEVYKLLDSISKPPTGWLRRRIQFYEDVTRRARIRQAGKLEELIRTELTESQTAFLSPSSHFESDWKLFQNAMESSPGGNKFVSSENEESCGVVRAFFVSSGFDDDIAGLIQFRAAALVESGIYGLWKYWEGLQRIFNGPRLRERYFVELSFSNSDIHMPFVALLVFLLASFVCFVAEVLTETIHEGRW